jgi:PAS domain S-box-containing protein
VFQFSSLRTRLIGAFLGVALLPLVLLTLTHFVVAAQVLRQNADQALLTAANQTSLRLDNFFKVGLDTVRVEADLPGLGKYLRLPAQQRSGSPEEAEVRNLFRSLLKRDTVNVLSYSLIDRQGTPVLSTDRASLHPNTADADYFRQPLATGVVYASSVYLPSSDGLPSLYFSSPVKDAAGVTVGVLVVRYNATVLQQLVTQSNNLAGPQSFAIVLDENYIRVAHGLGSDLLFKSVVPLPPEKVKALQAQLRLPQRPIADLSTNLAEMEQALRQSDCRGQECPPLFLSLSLAANPQLVSRVVVSRVQSRPWFVLFSQPQQVFIAPLIDEIRVSMALAGVVAGVVTVVAIVIVRWLTRPLAYLSSRVSQFTNGNLAIRAQITSKDEIGVLASNFNTLAKQVGKLLGGLEDRTHQLEASQRTTTAVSELARATLDSDRLLQEAVKLVQERFQVDLVQIYLWDAPLGSLGLRAQAGAISPERVCPQPTITLENEQSLVAIAARGRQMQTTGNLQSLDAAPGLGVSQYYQPTSEVALPLLSRGSLLGILDVQDSHGFRFSKTDLDTLSLLSSQIATALENAQLFSELQKTEERFRTIFEDAPIGIAIATIEGGQMVDGNKAFYTTLGYTAAEFQTLSFHQFTHPEDLIQDVQQLQKLLAGELDSYQLEKRMLRKDQTLVWVNLTATLLHDAAGKPLYSLGMIENITEAKRDEVVRRQAEVALRRSESQYRAKAQELQQALHDLQQAQTQLVQSEKMSSLGQLVAGIAHEINNPINFIYANLAYANQYQADLLRLLHLYQTHYPQPVAEIQAEAAEIDLNFLATDFGRILESMRVGSNRIREIVLSLRNFSRLDEAKMKPVNIHEGIDSTLVILQSQLKERRIRKPDLDYLRPTITVVKDYGELPLVECYAGQLNQVFINLLTNAIDALETRCTHDALQARTALQAQGSGASIRPPAEPPTIWIRTEYLTQEQIAIHITDNGLGVPPELKQKLFDPFFTTKQVGEGTGLGLSISYQIVVDQHRGRLSCNSANHQGAEFVVQIPSRQLSWETRSPLAP